MPSFNITIPETIESVSRPIIYSVLDLIKKYLLIHKDVRVIFPGDIGQWKQTAGDLKNRTKDSQFTSSRYLQLEVTQEPVETNLNSTAVYYGENPPIILDPQLGVQVTPIYSRTRVEMSIKYVTYNKDESMRWYYNARTQIAKMQDIYINTLDYHYPLPYPLMDLIETIYTLKENVAPDNESYQDYVLRTFTKRATMIAAMDGGGRRVAIKEKQTRLLGHFSFEPLPERPELIDDIQAWVCNFRYNFDYDLPMSLNMRYPLMVHNQFLPEPFLDYTFDPYHLDDKDLLFPETLKALRTFEPYRLWEDNVPFRIPKIDTFTPDTVLPGTQRIFSAMLQLSPTDEKLLCNLTDLDYLVLNPAIIDFLKQGENAYLTKPYQSIFNVSLYNGARLQTSAFLSCDSDLNLYSSQSLNLKDTYRIVFSVVSDWQALSSDAIYRLFYAIPAPTDNSFVPNLSDLPSNLGPLFSDILPTSASPTTSSAVDLTSDMVTYLYGDSEIPINVHTVPGYVDNLLNGKPAPGGKVHYSQQKIDQAVSYSPLYGSLTDYQKYLVLSNPFVNPNAIYKSIRGNPSEGSEVYALILKLLNLGSLDVNFLYRTRTGKNLYNDLSTTNNYMNNPRTQTDKTTALISAPLVNQQNTKNYIGFKTVMTSGIAAISSTVRSV